MVTLYSQYTEKLPEEFSIKHKITETTEKKNFHLHRQMEIIFSLSGNLKCKYEKGVVDIPKNGLILLNQMDLHYIFPEDGSGMCDRYVLYFTSNYISHFSTPEVNLLECFLPRPVSHPAILKVPKEQLNVFLSLLHKMDDCNIPDEGTTPSGCQKELYRKFLLGEFLLLTNNLFIKDFGAHSTAAYQEHTQLVYDIFEYISVHYSSDLSMSTLSKLFLVSKTQLYYIFKEISGLTVTEYITEYRLTKAKNFLINTDYSVELISQNVGYANISSFSRVFKGWTGYSPMQYRKKHAGRPD